MASTPGEGPQEADHVAFWLLDLDGTVLTVEEEYIRRTMDRVGRSLGRAFPDDLARRVWFGRDGPRDEILREGGIDPEAFWATFHGLEEPEARAAATRLHPDAAAIPELPGPKALVTHCQPYLTEPILREVGIEGWFDAVVCCSDRIGWKPDPAPVELAMARLGVDGTDGAVVGDSAADVEAARNAGLTGILVDREGDAPAGEAADRVVPSLRRLA